MARNILIFLAISCAFTPQGKASLTEKVLYKAWDKSSGQLSAAKLLSLKAQAEKLEFQERFTLTAMASGSLQKSKERQLAAFEGILQKQTRLSMGLRKATRFGVQGQINGNVLQTSNPFVQASTLAGIGVELQVDLLKDLLGHSTRAIEESLTQSYFAEKAEYEWNKAQIWSQLRKAYWSWVSVEEALRISKELLRSSRKQLRDTQKRYNAKIADQADLARAKAQVSSRFAEQKAYKHQSESIIRQIQEMVPALAGKTLELPSINEEAVLQSILQCTLPLMSEESTPLNNSGLKKALEHRLEEKELRLKGLERSSWWDLKLMARQEFVGKDFSRSNSIDDLKDHPRSRQTLMIELSIPLGGAPKHRKETQQKLATESYRAHQQAKAGKMEAFHKQTLKSIGLMKDVLELQKQNGQQLRTALKGSEKKFKQARIPLQSLIYDQNIYWQSKLSEIQAKTLIVHTLIDYLGVFNKTPCAFNRF